MAAETINEVFYNHIKSDTDFTSGFSNLSYIINETSVKSGYAIVYQTDDPKESVFLCSEDEGQTRFSCITFNRMYTTGVNRRRLLQSVVKKLESTVVDDFEIYRVKIENVSDSPQKTNGLYEFSFDAIVSWEK